MKFTKYLPIRISKVVHLSRNQLSLSLSPLALSLSPPPPLSHTLSLYTYIYSSISTSIALSLFRTAATCQYFVPTCSAHARARLPRCVAVAGISR